jgi:pSer/pThr/pTyr-binding forkhead associated (FHA) protein
MAPPVRAIGERSVGIPMSVDGDSQVPATSETVRFVRPTDEVVQLLPGHLEVLSGDTRHQEIRFVRVAGQQPQLILGRNPGRSPQHVALNSSTVSRQHARLAYSGGKWVVANLSKTNPVVVNNQELTNLDGERQLSDGDRIELGEVVLRFHAH